MKYWAFPNSVHCSVVTSTHIYRIHSKIKLRVKQHNDDDCAEGRRIRSSYPWTYKISKLFLLSTVKYNLSQWLILDSFGRRVDGVNNLSYINFCFTQKIFEVIINFFFFFFYQNDQGQSNHLEKPLYIIWVT